jgi:polysaccharide export outer membrane protein
MALQLAIGCTAAVPAQDLSKALSGSTFNRVGDYVISANDQINVKVFGQENLTGTYVVSPTGMLTMPLVGFVTAAGRTSVQLTDSLQKALKPFVKNPIITVSVAGRDSFQVYFSGEVGRPGEINLQRSTTLLQGLAMAGGLTRFASGRVVLLRQGGNSAIQRYSTTFYKLLSGKDQLDRFLLERGDYVHVE